MGGATRDDQLYAASRGSSTLQPRDVQAAMVY